MSAATTIATKSQERFTEAKPAVHSKYTREELRKALLLIVAQTQGQLQAILLQELATDAPDVVYEVNAAFVRDGPPACTVTSITLSAGGPEGYVKTIAPEMFHTPDGERGGMSGARLVEFLARACQMSVNDINAHFYITYGFIKLDDKTDVTLNTGTQEGKGLVCKRTFRVHKRRACIQCGARITGDDALHTSTGVFGRRIDAHKTCATTPSSINARGATFEFRLAKGKLTVTEPTGLTDIIACNHVLRVPQDTTAPALPAVTAVTIKQEVSDDEASVGSKRSIDMQSDAETTITKKPRVEVPAAPAAKKIDAPAARKPTNLHLALGELGEMFTGGTPTAIQIAALLGRYVTEARED